MEIVFPDPIRNFIAHAYLAVDFFFCLSGFVIAYAYDSKLAQIGIGTFLKLRLIRLHPLVVIGSVIGLVAFAFDPLSNLYSSYSSKTFWLFVSSCLMIPYPLVPERYFNLFHLNPPTWSLFWEYIANIVYALVLVRLPNRVLWGVAVIAAGLLGYEAYRSDFLGVGWSGENIMGGGFRVFYSFVIGMLVYRSQWIIPSRLGFLPVSILLFISFVIPFTKSTSGIVDVLVVVAYFPFLVAMGAGARLSTAFSGVCRFLGDISYPLYMVHYPFIWIFLSYVEVKKPGLYQLGVISAVGTVLLIGFAYLVMIALDMPIRTYLKNKLIKRTA